MLRLLFALLAIPSLKAQLLVDTYAGGAIPSGVPAQNAALGVISGIAWDASGNIVFADTTDNVIRRVRTDGILETIAGTGVTGFGGDAGPATSALINYPANLQYDGSGNLYFLDKENYRIRRIDTNGIVTTVVGDGQAPVAGLDSEGPATSRSISNDLSFAVDASGNIYIADPGIGSILRVSTNGNPNGNLEIFAQVSYPNAVAVDGSGNVYVSTASPSAILRISPAGTVSTFATFPIGSSPIGPLNQIDLLSADAAGNVYVWVNSQLLRYAPDGTSTVVPTPKGASGGAVDAQGNLAFVSNTSPSRYNPIQTFTTESVLTIVAGANPQPAPDGTPLQNAWFLGLGSIAFGHGGDLYIAESGACLIRKISTAGVLSTFAGTGTCGSTAPSGTAATANLSPPNSIAIDAKDRVYVLGVDSLYRVLSGGSYQAVILPASRGGSGIPLAGIGADSSGNVYFGENGPPAPNTYVVNDDATFTLKYANFGGYSLAFDPSRNVWGSVENLDTLNSSGIANVGLSGGFAGDGGPAQSARMDTLDSIVSGPDGNLYFADGYRIRRTTGSGPSAAPAFPANGVVNAVGYAGGPIAPGELISIFGSNFGATGLQVNSAVNNAVPQAIGRTKVLFSGSDGYSWGFRRRRTLIPKGTQTAFRAEGERFSERSDAGTSIVQEVFGFVKENLSGA